MNGFLHIKHQWFRLCPKRKIKTCQDCDQLRPFTVKRTCPAKSRIKTDTIEFFFQEDSSMDLAFRLIRRYFLNCFFSSKKILSNHLSDLHNTLISPIFYIAIQNRQFSVKSSKEVYWIVMFQKDAVCSGISWKNWCIECDKIQAV